MLVPSLIMFAVGGYIFYAQHNFPSVILKDDAEWDYLEAALYSSSFIKMSRVMRWFTANIGYHHVHHVNSRIPFYRLPEAMAKIPQLQSPRCTSLNPLEIWTCLHLKLWDEEHGRLIPLKEVRL
jgi:omega-6 fatty acid desaturase (delta-12 desaturase)